MASFNCQAGVLDLLDGTATYLGSTIKARLVASSASPDQDIDSLTGLTAIGTDVTLTTKTVTGDDTNNRIVFSGDTLTWGSIPSGSTIGWIIYYIDGANDAARVPISVTDVTDTPTNGSGFTHTPDGTNGFFYLQQ